MADDISLELSEALVNRAIAARLGASEGPVESAEVQPRSGGEILVRVKLRKPAFIPPVLVAARIEQQPQLPHSAVLVLTWSLPAMGFLSTLAGHAVSMFDAAPPGIRVDRERVYVDLQRLLAERGMPEAIKHATRLRVDTRDGVFVLTGDVQI